MPLGLRRGTVTAVLERHDGLVRLEVDGQRDGIPNVLVRSIAMRYKVVVWYAPDIQRFVKLQHQTWSSSAPYSEDTFELIEYRPPR